jgi:mannose-6-phosphate isomerase-like protein (cupin superfamily)
MADEVHDIVEGDGYAVAHIDALGDPYGFRKIRRLLGVTAFGANAVVIPPGYATPRHSHERQEELYFVHQGRVQIEFGDGSTHLLGPGGVARVDPATVRNLRNVGDGDAIFVSVGGKDGYVGRDGQVPEGDESPFQRPQGAAPPQ